ncbi:MAG: hypothetical protein ACTSWX_04160 [Promethearchaeota archaeon]
MNSPIQDEEERKLHDEEELRRYNALKRKKNLRFYLLVISIVFLVIIYILLTIFKRDIINQNFFN